MLYKSVSLFLFAIFGLISSAYGSVSSVAQTYAIGTLVTSKVIATTHSDLEKYHQIVNSETRRLERLMSAYDPDSDVSQLSTHAGQWLRVAPEVADILKRSLHIARLSNGTFDPTIGKLVKAWSVDQDSHRIPKDDEIKKALQYVNWKEIRIKEESGFYYAKIGTKQSLTLGAIGKGYIADRVGEKLRLEGCSDALLDFGGNIVALGKNATGQAWRIGLQRPDKERGNYFAILPASDTSIVTSGDYEKYFIQDGVKYHHLLNPKTGKPVQATLSSVTIVHPDSSLADGLCTALFVMGWTEAIDFLRHHPELQAVLVNHDLSIVAYTNNLKDSLEIVDNTLKVLLIQ